MDVKITPALLQGDITPPPSKSLAHRVILAAALAEGESRLSDMVRSDDISATLACARALGADCSPDGMRITGIGGRHFRGDVPLLDCGESGSTLRFLIPVALAVAQGGVFVGRGRLTERPLGPYEELFREKNIRFSRGNGEIQVSGELRPGEYRLAGDVSSQFITGLLFALPLLDGDSDIMLTKPLESAGYVALTLDVLKTFGVQAESTETGWHVPGNQHFSARDVAVEPDWSQAAFWMAADALGSRVRILGLNPESSQGDRMAEVYFDRLSDSGEVVLDMRDCPDLLPPLAVAAALRAGEITRFVGAGRLRWKESDRLDTVSMQLNRLGAQAEQGPDFLTIRGVPSLRGGTVFGCNDHRVAMMLAIAATHAEGSVVIRGVECVSKSYPNFWSDYAALGGATEEIT